MNNNIERTLFWFKDGDEMLTALNEDFFALGTLLNRLLNERYDGKKFKFINLDFATKKTYELHSNLPQDEPYYYGGHLRYYGVFDREQFDQFSRIEQNKYVWNKGYEYLIKSAISIKNEKLLEATEYAYKKGIEMDLNPDYRVVEADVNFSGQKLKASVWINFKEDGMYSKFTLEKDQEIVFEKQIDQTKKGIEFFLEMYKVIELENNYIVIKGRKDVEYLPLKISLDKLVF
jgi:hypothetical protein